MKLSVLITFLLAFNSQAQSTSLINEYSLTQSKSIHFTDFIDHEFMSGEYLIYHCYGGHFACVDNSGFDLCKSKRKTTFEQKMMVLSCAPLKKYASNFECIVHHHLFMEHPTVKDFCFNTNFVK